MSTQKANTTKQHNNAGASVGAASLHTEENSGPWWQHKHVWLVVGLPLIVVIASFITLYIAITHPDPVVDPNYYANGLKLSKPAPAAALVPAQAARNHATTGGLPEAQK